MTHLDAFADLINRPADRFPLLESAAAVAQYADEGFTPEDVVRQVRAWGEQLAARIAADTSPGNRLRLLNHFFFHELGFAPNDANYYSVDNSYLHRVIAQRRGIPVTLSLLYIEIGRAIRLKLAGVNAPNRFLVRLPVGNRVLYIDVYGGGRTLSPGEVDALRRRLAEADPDTPPEEHLRDATGREILVRMLRNLRTIHLRASDWQPLLEVQHRLVMLAPDEPEERRLRACAYERLECPRAAAEDLVAYLSLHPDPPDAHELRGSLARLRRAASRLN